MSAPVETKSAVTVSEMARMVGLSRARFYQLQTAGVFPPPVYNVTTRRPIYVEELQEVCLHVRRRNCGINGRPVLFYAKRITPALPTRSAGKTNTGPKDDRLDEIVGGLLSLGLSVTSANAQAAVNVLYPHGLPDDLGAVIRAVFVHLHRQDRGDSRSGPSGSKR